NRSCASADDPGEAISHHAGLPRAHPGRWGTGIFCRKSTLPSRTTVLESPERGESPQASGNRLICDLALEAMRKQPGGQPGKANS
ncbi:hypothetical protein PANDA_008464, partial [Ailuropoda melanoleuca]